MVNYFKHLPLCVLLTLLASLSMMSCGEKTDSQQAKIDSLENANTLGKMDSDYLRDYIAVIAEGLDSITAGEGEILNVDPERGDAMNRQQMKEKLGTIRDILARHKDRIADLEKQLADAIDKGNRDAKNLQSIITALRTQLDQKDAELARLRADLDDSRKSIEELTGRIDRMQEVQDEQNRTIEKQAAKINDAFIKIASKAELKSLGLLNGGNLFKKSSIDYSSIDLSVFTRVDKRTTSSITLPKKFKILTPVPSSSYEVEDNGDSKELYITNSEQFWSASNFLIIQAN